MAKPSSCRAIRESASRGYSTNSAPAWQQEARLFELRAAASLARLWQAQGKRGASKDLLTGVVNWFQEGRDTPDQIDARNLLAVLA